MTRRDAETDWSWPMRIAPEVVLTRKEQAELTGLARPESGDERLAQRARIVLLAAQGLQNKEIAAQLNVGRVQVARWRERFLRLRRAGIERDFPRRAPAPGLDAGRLVQPGSWADAQPNTHSMLVAPGVNSVSQSQHRRAHGTAAAARQAGNASRSRAAADFGAATVGKNGAGKTGQTVPRLAKPGVDSLWDELTALKRERILQEASRLFYERGYAQTSVDAIAERVGATKPFVYSHFGSKIDLLVEVCERSNREALGAAERALSGAGSPRERFVGFVLEFTDVALRLHQDVAIYFREQCNLPPEAADRINEMRKSISTGLALLLAEGECAGEFEVGDTRMAALVIAGMSSYGFAWYRENGRLNRQQVAERIAQMALKLVSPSSVPMNT